MGDEDDAHALGAQAAHDGEEVGDFFFVEAGGGFVEDEEAGGAIEGAGDRDHLLERDGEGAELGVDVEVEAEAGEGFFGVASGGAPVDEAQAAGLAAEGEVFGDGQRRDEVDLLIDGRDAAGFGVGRRTRGDASALEGDFAGVGGVDAGEDLDERGFAGAVFAEERVDFAGADGEVDGVEGDDAGETFPDAAGGEEGSGGVGHRGKSDQGTKRERKGDIVNRACLRRVQVSMTVKRPRRGATRKLQGPRSKLQGATKHRGSSGLGGFTVKWGWSGVGGGWVEGGGAMTCPNMCAPQSRGRETGVSVATGC